MFSMGQRKRLQLARLMAIHRPIWFLNELYVALDDEGVEIFGVYHRQESEVFRNCMG